MYMYTLTKIYVKTVRFIYGVKMTSWLEI